MKFGAVDIFTILLITIGPLKGMILFAALTAQADATFRRKVAMRAVATATGVVLLFIVAGELMLQIFHVTLPALKIAGGIILLLVALHMVMGEMGNEGKDTGTAAEPSLGIAVYPIAVPMLATPQGIVAIVALTAAATPAQLVLIVVFSLAIMAFNLIVLLAAGRIVRVIGESGVQIMAKIAGILLAALAIQLMLLALQDLGVLERAAH
ncbi:MAG: MarC family protein [Rhodospirillales bacterium]